MNGITESKFKIDGMTCASCVLRVEKLVGQVPGVVSVSVNLALENAVVKYDASKVDGKHIIAAVENGGYHAQSITDKIPTIDQAKEKKELRTEQAMILVGILLSLPMVLPMLLGSFLNLPMPPGWLQFCLAFPVQFVLGWRFYRGAWKALRTGSATMDVLVVMGTSAAFFLSTYLLLTKPLNHHTHLYYESSSVIITLILLGRYLEKSAKNQTASAIKALGKLRPEKVRIQQGISEIYIGLDQLKVGDRVVVLAGETIPADGQIVEGVSSVDESLLTGESLPVAKKEGDLLTGGSINGEGRLVIQVRSVGSDSTLSKIIKLVEQAQGAKAPIQKLVDKISSIFVPAVLVVALTTLLLTGILTSNWEEAFISSIAVLVIACPCALGLATPTAIIVGMGAAARSGILIRDAETLEKFQKISTVVFDKTGTVTVGRPELKAFHTFGDLTTNLLDGEFSVQKWKGHGADLFNKACSIQAGSEHPLAKAILRYAQKNGLIFISSANVKSLPGKGVESIENEQVWIIGTQRLFEERNFDLTPYRELLERYQNLGFTLSFIGVAGRSIPEGLLAFSDAVRPGAFRSIDSLKKNGINAILLTGDGQKSAQKIANEIGITTYYFEKLPQEKSEIISMLKKEGKKVAMVGDGINDAPALASADIGIAMGSGSDIAMKAADVTLLYSHPQRVFDAITIAQRTHRKIKQNLFWAFIFNMVGIPLAAFGLLNPIIAGAAMAMSSVSVVLNSLTLRSWKATPTNSDE